MEQPQSFNQRQRELFARMLEGAKKRAEAELEDDSDLNDRVAAEIMPKLAEERGATSLIAQIRKSQKEVDDAEEALRDLGFSCDEDSISLKWNAPKDLGRALDAAKRSARKERNTALKKYDLAILGVWTAQDPQDAKRVVEEIL